MRHCRSWFLDERASIPVVARRNGVAPNLLYRWRRLMLEGGSVAVTEDDDVTSDRVVRQLEERVRDLERHLGRRTLEAEIRARPGTKRSTGSFSDPPHTWRAVVNAGIGGSDIRDNRAS